MFNDSNDVLPVYRETGSYLELLSYNIEWYLTNTQFSAFTPKFYEVSYQLKRTLSEIKQEFSQNLRFDSF